MEASGNQPFGRVHGEPEVAQAAGKVLPQRCGSSQKITKRPTQDVPADATEAKVAKGVPADTNEAEIAKDVADSKEIDIAKDVATEPLQESLEGSMNVKATAAETQHGLALEGAGVAGQGELRVHGPYSKRCSGWPYSFSFLSIDGCENSYSCLSMDSVWL